MTLLLFFFLFFFNIFFFLPLEVGNYILRHEFVVILNRIFCFSGEGAVLGRWRSLDVGFFVGGVALLGLVWPVLRVGDVFTWLNHHLDALFKGQQ